MKCFHNQWACTYTHTPSLYLQSFLWSPKFISLCFKIIFFIVCIFYMSVSWPGPVAEPDELRFHQKLLLWHFQASFADPESSDNWNRQPCFWMLIKADTKTQSNSYYHQWTLERPLNSKPFEIWYYYSWANNWFFFNNNQFVLKWNRTFWFYLTETKNKDNLFQVEQKLLFISIFLGGRMSFC